MSDNKAMEGVKGSTIQNDAKLAVKHSPALIEIIKQEIPSKIFIFILVFRELSLTRLANLIGKSKATILRHIKPMIERGVVSEVKKEKSRENYYILAEEITMNPIEHLYALGIEEMTQEERKEMYNSLIDTRELAFRFLKKLISPTIDYIELFKETRQDIPIADNKTFSQLSEDMKLEILSSTFSEKFNDVFEESLKCFRANYHEGRNKLETERETKQEIEELDNDYLLFIIKLPIKKILRWT